MALVRRNQYWLPSIFNDIFDDDFMNTNIARSNSTSPAVNIIENEKDFTVEVAAPGLTKNDFKINVTNDNELTIEMEKKYEDKEHEGKKNGKYLRREFSYSRFQQSLLLPDTIDRKGISAKMEHGVLTIVLPKKEEEKPIDTTQTIAIE
ncbi:MAG: Hsp20/alpha crystallin family protein [Bacteroidetes bacterium]|uniref:Hsp20/alpha crystallin family protein n=1 Tax=Candidatus Merdivivens pullicola TaxID=2840872 RepID=A0A9D9NHJ6_9BACT|nr:Hsp20/alpha crystallin family protein [Candidatus Merdivivens pullicola]